MKKVLINGRINFLGKEIPVIEGGFGEGKRCLTDKSIAEIHEMKNIHIRELINRNISRFKEYIDFVDLKVIVQNDNNLLNNLGYSNMQISKAKNIYLLSERGYSKLIKIMDTDLAWEIHDKLMDEYFSMREIISSNDQLKAMALLRATEGKSVEERLSGITTYTSIRVKEETKPLLETINCKEQIIDNVINDDGVYAVRTVGKILKPYTQNKLGANKIFTYLRDNKILMDKQGKQNHNMPYDKYQKYFNVKYNNIEINGKSHTFYKCYFNGIGLKWFLNKLVKNNLMMKNNIEVVQKKIINI